MFDIEILTAKHNLFMTTLWLLREFTKHVKSCCFSIGNWSSGICDKCLDIFLWRTLVA